MSKLITCKTCGAEIAKSTKKCPSCGAKRKKFPWWTIPIIVIAAIVIIVASGGGEDNSVPEDVTYTAYNVTDLFDELSANAMRAEQHEDEYVTITGHLSSIDSDGKYFSIGADEEDWDYMFDSIQCYFTDDTQKDVIINLNTNDTVTVSGKITDVGEILGYTMNVTEVSVAE